MTGIDREERQICQYVALPGGLGIKCIKGGGLGVCWRGGGGDFTDWYVENRRGIHD